MTSLSTNNSHAKNVVATFDYCVGRLDRIHKASWLDGSINSSHSGCRANTVWLFSKHFIYLSTIFALTFIIDGGASYIGFTDEEFYEEYGLYYVVEAIYFILGNFAFYSYFMVFSIKHPPLFTCNFNYSGLTCGLIKTQSQFIEFQHLVISFFIYIVFNSITMYFFVVKYSKQISIHTNFLDFECEIFECEYFEYFYAYMLILVPFGSPVLHSLILLFLGFILKYIRVSHDYTDINDHESESKQPITRSNSITNDHDGDHDHANDHPSFLPDQQQNNNSVEMTQLELSPMTTTTTDATVNDNNNNNNKRCNDSQLQCNASDSDCCNQQIVQVVEATDYGYVKAASRSPERQGSLSLDGQVGYKLGSYYQVNYDYDVYLKLLIHFTVLWILWLLFGCISFIMNNMHDEILEHWWDYFYYGWLISTSLFKFILKKIVRRVDKLRILVSIDKCNFRYKFGSDDEVTILDTTDSTHNNNNNNNNNDNDKSQLVSQSHTIVPLHDDNTSGKERFDHLLDGSNADELESECGDSEDCEKCNQCKDQVVIFSLEWVVEVLLSLIYWYGYRQYTMLFLLKLIDTQSVSAVGLTFITHIVSEILQTYKVTRFYFDWSSKMQNKLIDKVEHYHCNEWQLKIVKTFMDDSTEKQWIIRNSIDIIIRFCISVITALWLFIWNVIAMKAEYDWSDDYLAKAMWFTLVSFGSEFICFVFLIVFVYKQNGENLMELYYKVVWQKKKNGKYYHRYYYVGAWIISGLFVHGTIHKLCFSFLAVGSE